MEKEMCSFIQKSQVLGCVTLALLDKGKRSFHKDRFMEICAHIDDVIRKENNAVLEFREPLCEVVSKWSDYYTYTHKYDSQYGGNDDIVHIKENTNKRAIEYYFTNSMPNDVRNTICKIFNEHI